MPNIDLDTLIVLRYEFFYKILRRVANGEDVDEIIDELMNTGTVDPWADATPES